MCREPIGDNHEWLRPIILGGDRRTIATNDCPRRNRARKTNNLLAQPLFLVLEILQEFIERLLVQKSIELRTVILD
jgi:hypothetical protein